MYYIAMASSSSSDFYEALTYAFSCLKQDSITLMAEKSQALQLLFDGRVMFIWFPTGYGKALLSVATLFNGLQAW